MATQIVKVMFNVNDMAPMTQKNTVSSDLIPPKYKANINTTVVLKLTKTIINYVNKLSQLDHLNAPG